MKGVSDFIKEHEIYIKESSNSPFFQKKHLEALAILRHERLIHLIVTMAVSFFLLILFLFFLFKPAVMVFVLFFIFLILDSAYLFHYFKLENSVIKWEMIAYQIVEKNNKQ